MKILALDGGGIRGVFSAQLLYRMEIDVHQPIRKCFDMVAGTSTGSLIAGAIIAEKSMGEMVHFYRKYGHKVFYRRSRLGLFHTVYNHSTLKKVLKNKIGDLLLGDIQQPLLIPSVNYKHGSIHIFRSAFSEKGKRDAQIPLIDAILSSCSAPVFFPPQLIKHAYLAGDGGLWANNPSIVCLTEALETFQVNLNDIHILSLGTGQQKVSLTHQNSNLQNWGFFRWFEFDFLPFNLKPKLLDLALHLSSESITYQCEILCQDRFLRLNTDLGKEIPFDDWKQVDQLIMLADRVYEEQKENILNFL